MDAMLRDIRHAWRTMARSPATTAVAILTLGLGIGAATAMFSLVYGILVRPFPYRDAGRLVRIDATRRFAGIRDASWNYSYADLQDWQARQSFESVAFVRSADFALSGDGHSERVFGAAVSGDFFATLEGMFVRGRPLTRSDDDEPVAVLSEQLWNSRFGRSPDIVGRQIRLNGQPYAVVGIVAADL